jgi:peroxiredoxin
MKKKLDVLATAPDFELTDTQDQILKLSQMWEDKIVVLVALRGFA